MFRSSLKLKSFDCRNQEEDENPLDRIIRYYNDINNFTTEENFTIYHNIVISYINYDDYTNAIQNKLRHEFRGTPLNKDTQKLYTDKSLIKSNELSNFKILVSKIFSLFSGRTNEFAYDKLLVAYKKRNGLVANQEEVDKNMKANAFGFQSIKNYFNNGLQNMIYIKLTNEPLRFENTENQLNLDKELKELQRLNDIEYCIKHFSKYCIVFDIFPKEIIYIISFIMIKIELKSSIFNQLLLWSFSKSNYLLASLNDKWSDIFKISRGNPKFYLLLYKLSCKSIIKFKY